MVGKAVVNWQKHFYKFQSVEERPVDKRHLKSAVGKCNYCGQVYVLEIGSCLRHLLNVRSVCRVSLEILSRCRICDARLRQKIERACWHSYDDAKVLMCQVLRGRRTSNVVG
jgi:hypothetical protein